MVIPFAFVKPHSPTFYYVQNEHLYTAPKVFLMHEQFHVIVWTSCNNVKVKSVNSVTFAPRSGFLKHINIFLVLSQKTWNGSSYCMKINTWTVSSYGRISFLHFTLLLAIVHTFWDSVVDLMTVCEVFRKENMITCYHDTMITLSWYHDNLIMITW
jgi:hypothetical protein